MTQYTCKICGNTFERDLNLLQKDKNYKYEYCGKTCAQASRYTVLITSSTTKVPYSSKEEKEFGEMIKSFFPLLESQHRLKGYHHCYDFYSPELQLLIEYDGVYWHNKPRQQVKDKKHLNEAKRQKVKLCVITDKEWKLFIDSGLPSKQKLLKLLNYNIKN